MQLQSGGEGFCAVGALRNAFWVLGKRISQRRIATAAGTTAEGTDSPQVLAAARHFGFVATEYETDDPIAAWGWVSECIRNDRPVLLCTLSWRHWVTAGGLIGSRVVVMDPTNEKFNQTENGVHVMAKKDFMKRWMHRENGIYSGISVGRK